MPDEEVVDKPPTPRWVYEDDGDVAKDDDGSEKQQESEDAMSEIFGSSSDAGTPRMPSTPESPKEAPSSGPVASKVRVLEPEDLSGGLNDAKHDDEEEDGEMVARPVGPPLKITAPLTSRPDKTKLKLVKMTNFVAIEKRPFDPLNYTKVDTTSESFGDQAVMRWRVNENGERESNSRFVRWNDGRLSLFIGSECFDVDEREVDNAFLYLRHQTVMQGMGGISKKFIFRPAEVKKRRSKVGGQAKGATRQMAKVQKITTLTDPAKEKEERTRREEERIRDRELLARKQRKEMEKYYVPHATQLGGGYLDSPAEDDKFNGRSRRETSRKRTSSRRDHVGDRKPKKQKHDDFIDEGDELDEDDDYAGEEEFIDEPEWNDDYDSEQGDEQGRKGGVEVGEGVEDVNEGIDEGEEDDSDDDGGIQANTRAGSKSGRTFVLSDEDDEI